MTLGLDKHIVQYFLIDVNSSQYFGLGTYIARRINLFFFSYFNNWFGPSVPTQEFYFQGSQIAEKIAKIPVKPTFLESMRTL